MFDFQLDLANFITLLTNAAPKETFTPALLQKLQTIVMNMVSMSNKAQNAAFIDAFQTVLERTLAQYSGQEVTQKRSMLLRDINGLLYDVVLENEEEEEREEEDAVGEDVDEEEEDEQLIEKQDSDVEVETTPRGSNPELAKYESSLQWKEVVEGMFSD
jgi:DNA-binding protein Fis